MTFAVTVNLRAKAFQANQFVEHVKRMHEEKDKGFEEEFKVTEAQHASFMYSPYRSMLKHAHNKHHAFITVLHIKQPALIYSCMFATYKLYLHLHECRKLLMIQTEFTTLLQPTAPRTDTTTYTPVSLNVLISDCSKNCSYRKVC